MSSWRIMNGSATAMLRSPNATSSPEENPAPRPATATRWKRISAYSAAISDTPESSALTGLGAWLWASGSQVWNGTSPTFVP